MFFFLKLGSSRLGICTQSTGQLGGVQNWPSSYTPVYDPSRKKQCILTEDCIAHMRKVYQRLDRYGDLVVPRTNLVKEIQDDPNMKYYLNRGAIRYPEINKEIPLRTVLHQIEEDTMMPNDNNDYLNT